MKVNTGNPFYRPRAVNRTLRGIIPSCVCDLDATRQVSYGGSGQNWANMVASPSDGSSRSAYNFVLGDTSAVAGNDPTFTGGVGSPSAYFALDGGDRFLLSGNNTTFIKNMPKSTGGTSFWFTLAFRYASPPSGAALYSCKSTSTTQGITLVTTSDRLQFSQYGDTGSSATVAGSGPLLVNGTHYLVIVSRQAGGTATRFWVNSRSKLDLAHSYNACVTDSTGKFSIGASPGGGSALGSGTRIYGFGMGNGFLDDAAAAKIFDLYNARHGRVYG